MSAATVAHARGLLDGLLSADLRPGSTDQTLRAISRREGIPYAQLWALRYRPPKDVYAATLIALSAAHAKMCDRQLAKYRAAVEATDPAASGLALALTRLAAAIAGGAAGPETEG